MRPRPAALPSLTHLVPRLQPGSPGALPWAGSRSARYPSPSLGPAGQQEPPMRRPRLRAPSARLAKAPCARGRRWEPVRALLAGARLPLLSSAPAGIAPGRAQPQRRVSFPGAEADPGTLRPAPAARQGRGCGGGRGPAGRKGVSGSGLKRHSPLSSLPVPPLPALGLPPNPNPLHPGRGGSPASRRHGARSRRRGGCMCRMVSAQGGWVCVESSQEGEDMETQLSKTPETRGSDQWISVGLEAWVGSWPRCWD